jgi:hypothetical protein
VADRFCVPFQGFITSGLIITVAEAGRVATAGNTTLNLTTSVAAGTFTVTLGSGCTGTLTSGTATITGSPQALAAGANTCTADGAGNCTMNLTLGTAANTNTVNTYSATSGGVSGASIPTSADNFYADANSFTAASQVVTVDAAANCLNMDWTGATNTPTLLGTNYIYCYGNFTVINGMNWNHAYYLDFLATSGTQTITLNGKSLGGSTVRMMGAGGTRTLAGEITATALTINKGVFNTGGYTLSVGAVAVGYPDNKTVTLGSSIINCSSWSWVPSGGTATLTANTSVINCSGNFTGGGLTTYNVVNISAATSTITGNNTFATLGFTRAGVQTITATGTTQTFKSLIRNPGNQVKTLVNGTYTKIQGGGVNLDYMSISGSTANTLYAGPLTHSTDGGGNTGWVFTYPPEVTISRVRRYLAAGAI